MITLPLALFQSYRAQVFRYLPGHQLSNPDEAIAFVKERGFVFFWPITGIVLPSLWAAVAGNRPVADEHDDPGHVTWGWKDEFLGKRAWYYAKGLRKKGTMIGLDVVPYFYALSENYGAPEEDYLTLYEQGRMPLETKQVYEALLDEGPLDTIALRKAARLTSRDGATRFDRALADLQADFKIVPTAVTQAGAWHYAYAYDVVHRAYPELLEQARFIGELDARQRLVALYFRSVGGAQVREVIKLFGWNPPEAAQTLERLAQRGEIQRVEVEKQTGEWWALTELIN
jgi:hypothetical protein